MASNYEKEPIFVLERAWDDKTKMPEKYKFQGTAGKAEDHISSGALAMEVFSKKLFPNLQELAWIGPGASRSQNLRAFSQIVTK